MKKNEVGASGLCGTSSQNSGFFCLKSGPSLRICVSSEKPLYLPELWKLTVSSWHSVSSADSQAPTPKKTELAKFDVLWSEHLDILAPRVVPEALLAECGDSKSFCKQCVLFTVPPLSTIFVLCTGSTWMGLLLCLPLWSTRTMPFGSKHPMRLRGFFP